MARVNLTAGRIRSFITDKAQAFLWDSDAPGLAVRATRPSKANTSGLKAFIFQAELPDDRSVRITIGDVQSWGIDAARTEARRLQTLVDKGIDPRQEKEDRIAEVEEKRKISEAQVLEQAVQDRRQAVSVQQAWDHYITYQKEKMQRQNIERGKKWGERHLLDHHRMTQLGGEPRKRGNGLTVSGVLCPLLSMRLGEITPQVLKEWQRKEAETRANNARQGYEAFRSFWRWCANQAEYKPIIDASALEDQELRDEVPSRKPKQADCLQREQLSAWFKFVREIGNPVIAVYLQGLLLTGARREELAGLTWADVDFQWKSLTIRDKVEGERIIPLTPYLASLLYALPRRKDVDGKPVPWVFSSPTAASGRIQEPRIAHTRALAAAGLPHLSLHGLRRSFGTLAEWVECPTGVVAQIMGHKPSAIAEKHYRRRPLDLLRMWHVRIEAWMLEQAGISQPEENTEGLRLVNGKAA